MNKEATGLATRGNSLCYYRKIKQRVSEIIMILGKDDVATNSDLVVVQVDYNLKWHYTAFVIASGKEDFCFHLNDSTSSLHLMPSNANAFPIPSYEIDQAF